MNMIVTTMMSCARRRGRTDRRTIRSATVTAIHAMTKLPAPIRGQSVSCTAAATGSKKWLLSMCALSLRTMALLARNARPSSIQHSNRTTQAAAALSGLAITALGSNRFIRRAVDDRSCWSTAHRGAPGRTPGSAIDEPPDELADERAFVKVGNQGISSPRWQGVAKHAPQLHSSVEFHICQDNDCSIDVA